MCKKCNLVKRNEPVQRSGYYDALDGDVAGKIFVSWNNGLTTTTSLCLPCAEESRIKDEFHE